MLWGTGTQCDKAVMDRQGWSRNENNGLPNRQGDTISEWIKTSTLCVEARHNHPRPLCWNTWHTLHSKHDACSWKPSRRLRTNVHGRQPCLFGMVSIIEMWLSHSLAQYEFAWQWPVLFIREINQTLHRLSTSDLAGLSVGKDWPTVMSR